MAVKRLLPPSNKASNTPYNRSIDLEDQEHRNGATSSWGMMASSMKPASATLSAILTKKDENSGNRNGKSSKTKRRKQLEKSLMEELSYLSKLRHPVRAEDCTLSDAKRLSLSSHALFELFSRLMLLLGSVLQL